MGNILAESREFPVITYVAISPSSRDPLEIDVGVRIERRRRRIGRSLRPRQRPRSTRRLHPQRPGDERRQSTPDAQAAIRPGLGDVVRLRPQHVAVGADRVRLQRRRGR